MESGSRTRLAKAFCSARDRNIPVLVRAGDWDGDVPSAVHAEKAVNCLDYGVFCTGWLCPLFPIPTLPVESLLEEAMAAELERRDRSIAEGRAILERALRQARARDETDGPRRETPPRPPAGS